MAGAQGGSGRVSGVVGGYGISVVEPIHERKPTREYKGDIPRDDITARVEMFFAVGFCNILEMLMLALSI